MSQQPNNRQYLPSTDSGTTPTAAAPPLCSPPRVSPYASLPPLHSATDLLPDASCFHEVSASLPSPPPSLSYTTRATVGIGTPAASHDGGSAVTPGTGSSVGRRCSNGQQGGGAFSSWHLWAHSSGGPRGSHRARASHNPGTEASSPAKPGIWARSKCFWFGSHTGTFHYMQDSSCVQELVCSACGVTQQRVVHTMGPEIYSSLESCELCVFCTRCATRETRGIEHAALESHKWYEKDGSCLLVRKCSKCGGHQASGYLHEYGEPVYCCGAEGLPTKPGSPDMCKMHRICRRCGDSEPHGVFHVMGEPSYFTPGSCVLHSKCNRCGTLEERGLVHQMGPRLFLQSGGRKMEIISDTSQADAGAVVLFGENGAESSSCEPGTNQGQGLPGSCTSAIFCQRCGYAEITEKHEWSYPPPTAEVESCCKRVCRRCGKIDKPRTGT
ncbi:hypothetical protein Pelo_16789 [Pelomyxa schiedti]|nr:hypothetical protein Pelo_16789 [Pelomyxa schiedti]